MVSLYKNQFINLPYSLGNWFLYPMVSLYKNQFINLPYSLGNWFLYGEIVDGCEIYLILTVENYIFRVPS